MKLDPNIAREVSNTLNQPLPKPSSEAFDELLLKLRRENPALAQTLQSGIIHTELGDMETQARTRSVGEHRLRGLRRTLFQRQDDLDQEWHISKLKMLAWGSLIPLLFFGSFFLGPTLVGSAKPPVVEAAPVPTVEPTVALTATPQDEDPFQGQPEVVYRNNRVANVVAGSQNPKVATQEEAATEEPLAVSDFGLGDAETSLSAREQPSQASTEPATEPMLGGDPQLPLTSEAEDPGLGVYRAGSSESSADPGLAVYRSGGDASIATQTASDDPFAQPGTADGDGPVGLAAYRRAEPQEETPSGLQAFTQEPVQETELSAYTQAPPQPLTAAGSSGLPVSAAAEQNAYLSSGIAFTPDNSAPAAAGGEPYAVGDSLDATLQTGVVALGDAPLPVLAQADDGSIWQGQATLAPTGRVDLRFSEVLTKNGQYQVTAVGQSGDGYLGLQAQVSETTPALASDLARGALRGLSDYVQALGDQTEVRLEGGTPIISRDAPPLEASIAGSVAQLFTPPEGDEQQALVRLAQIPADTKLKVVVLSREDVAPR